jgi:hypothetical protein
MNDAGAIDWEVRAWIIDLLSDRWVHEMPNHNIVMMAEHRFPGVDVRAILRAMWKQGVLVARPPTGRWKTWGVWYCGIKNLQMISLAERAVNQVEG